MPEAPDDARSGIVTGMESFVSVRRVSYSYRLPRDVAAAVMGKTPQEHSVLRDVSFELQAGEHVVVYGPEASGKSTLLRILAGVLAPSRGAVVLPDALKGVQAAGYVSRDESEPRGDSVYEALHAFGATHEQGNLPARISDVAEQVGIKPILQRPARGLSTTERMRVNIARAVLSECPLILLDDVADELGVAETQEIINRVAPDRAVIIATRSVNTAEELNWPLLLLHGGQLIQRGTRDELAHSVTVPRMMDVWLEGLRYDLLRQLRRHPGVDRVELVPAGSFSGQRLRITLKSSRYLPSLYDTVSSGDVIQVEEVPPSLRDIVAKLS